MLDGGEMLVSPAAAVPVVTTTTTGYYVVRSPSSSTHSHAKSAATAATAMEDYCGSSTLSLSRYSSSSTSHGSNNDDDQSYGGPGPKRIMCVRDVLVAEDEDDDDDDCDRDDANNDGGVYQLGGGRHRIHGLIRRSRSRKRGCCGKYFSITAISSSSSSGPFWICLQIGWRVVLSFAAALLVFYICTKPPPPKFHIQMAGIRQFGLSEGVDATGIPTKVLSCNCSINLVIDNKSNIFGLHVQPPILEMSFGLIPFAMSRGTKLLAETYGSTLFILYVGTRNKPMYGAGRSMQDMLDSPSGLPLTVRVSLRSNFRVVGDLIKPKFHHQAHCSLFLQRKRNSNKHEIIHSYNSSCIIT